MHAKTPEAASSIIQNCAMTKLNISMTKTSTNY